MTTPPTATSTGVRKVNRTLFRSGSTESGNLEQQVLDYMEPPRSSSSKSQSQSVESLDQESSSRSQSPQKPVLPALDENELLSPQQPRSLRKSGSCASIRSNLVGTPVTENDPLGALQSPAKSTSLTTPVRTPTPTKIRIDDDFLGMMQLLTFCNFFYF